MLSNLPGEGKVPVYRTCDGMKLKQVVNSRAKNFLLGDEHVSEKVYLLYTVIDGTSKVSFFYFLF